MRAPNAPNEIADVETVIGRSLPRDLRDALLAGTHEVYGTEMVSDLADADVDWFAAHP